MAVLPFGEWLPDQPDFNNPGASTITNVVPLTNQSYGPMPSPSVYSGALTNRCQGAYGFLDDGANVRIFAGDASTLYMLTAGSAPNFANISKGGGHPYTTASFLNPQIPTAPSWDFTSFGQRIIATNYSDNIQTFLCGTDTAFSDLSASAPKARYATVIRDFLMVGNTDDGTFGVQPRRVWWPKIGDPTTWPTPGTNTAIQDQSDYQDLEQSDLGQITRLVGGHLSSADGAVWCERGIYSVQYVGSGSGIFSFQVAQGALGTQAPLSVVLHRLSTGFGNRAVAYYWGGDDFYAFDGAFSIPIGAQKVAKTIQADISAASLSTIQGGTVPFAPLVYWLYASATGGQSGLYDRLVLYNPIIQRWTLINLFVNGAEWGTIATAPGFTLDALNTFGTIDQLPAPLGSGYYSGGNSILAAFDSSHKLNFITGTPLAPIVETSESQPTPGRRSKIISARPLCTGTSLSPSVSIATRDRLIDSVVYQAAVAVNAIGECPQLTTGRYARARLTLPSGSNFTHLQGVEVEVIEEGRR